MQAVFLFFLLFSLYPHIYFIKIWLLILGMRIKEGCPAGQSSCVFPLFYPFTAPAATPLIMCFWQDR